MDKRELEKRRAKKLELGWDECGATGAGHDPENKPQSDGNYYCKYCGAEILPEELS